MDVDTIMFALFILPFGILVWIGSLFCIWNMYLSFRETK